MLVVTNKKESGREGKKRKKERRSPKRQKRQEQLARGEGVKRLSPPTSTLNEPVSTVHRQHLFMMDVMVTIADAKTVEKLEMNEGRRVERGVVHCHVPRVGDRYRNRKQGPWHWHSQERREIGERTSMRWVS